MIISQELHNVRLNDTRLERRVGVVCQNFMKNPNKSIPAASSDWAQTKACYRFLNNRKVTREKLLNPHYTQTGERCKSRGSILVIEDTTTLSYPAHKGKRGFGVVGTKSEQGRGMLVHSTLAVDHMTHEPLGLIHQEVIIRKEFYPSRGNRRSKRNRATESSKWLGGIRSFVDLLPDKNDAIFVADREADFFDFMQEITTSGNSFVIRQVHNRKTDGGYISEVLEKSRTMGECSVTIQRNGTRKQRIARIELSVCQEIAIYPPIALDRKGQPLLVNILCAQEMDPPPDTEPLNWKLITTLPVNSEASCKDVLKCYQSRWMIEEFHKGLKTGCSIEERQLIERSAIENLLGIFSVIAVILLHLRFCSRTDNQTNNFTPLMSETQKEILIRRFENLGTKPKPRELLIAVARLGGFLARKGDGDPGWLLIIKGYMALLEMEQGYLLALKHMGKR